MTNPILDTPRKGLTRALCVAHACEGQWGAIAKKFLRSGGRRALYMQLKKPAGGNYSQDRHNILLAFERRTNEAMSYFRLAIAGPKQEYSDNVAKGGLNYSAGLIDTQEYKELVTPYWAKFEAILLPAQESYRSKVRQFQREYMKEIRKAKDKHNQALAVAFADALGLE